MLWFLNVLQKTQKEKLLKLDHISPLKLDQFDPLSGPYLCSPLQASTGELLTCLSNFLRHRCVKLKELSSNQVILWFRKVDRALLVQGWQVGTPPALFGVLYQNRCSKKVRFHL